MGDGHPCMCGGDLQRHPRGFSTDAHRRFLLGLRWGLLFCEQRVLWWPRPNGCAVTVFHACRRYLAAFAPGMGPMPWTINAEIFPLHARSACVATTTAVNWILNFVVALTFLTLADAVTLCVVGPWLRSQLSVTPCCACCIAGTDASGCMQELVWPGGCGCRVPSLRLETSLSKTLPWFVRFTG